MEPAVSPETPQRPAAPAPRHLGALPGRRRLAVGLFVLSLLGFYGLAQVQLATAVGGGTPLPGPEKVLLRYHGGDASRLERALDPSLPELDERNMYAKLVPADERPALRRKILDWVERGAPREGWAEVAPILASEDNCGFCHSKRPMEDGGPRQRVDLPFDAYEEVLVVARRGAGMSLGELAETSHNHAFGFTVAAFLVSLVFSFTRWRGAIVPALVLAASVGAAVDIASWWLTRSYGSPWQWGVILGGALFGASISAMAVLSLDEAWAGGRLGDLLEKALRPLGLGRREPA